ASASTPLVNTEKRRRNLEFVKLYINPDKVRRHGRSPLTPEESGGSSG
ncbi:unnamed protein product, partial [Prunus brigantina]